MSDATACAETFASGRYSKRKRTQVAYRLDELDYSDTESDFASPPAKKPKAKAWRSRPLAKQSIFPFLQLPAEIRNTIYEYTLCDDFGINLLGTFKHRRRTVGRISASLMAQASKSDNVWASRRLNNQLLACDEEPSMTPVVPLVPSLLAVNRQIHLEAVDMLYGNEFVFADSFALYSFLLNIGPARAKHLKRLRLLSFAEGRGMKGYNHSCFAVLAWATNLSAFHINTHMGGYRVADDGAGQLYRDAFPWLEAVGAAKGKADAALDVLHLGEDCFQGHRWGRNINASVEDGYEDREARFKEALRKCLDKHRQKLMAPSGGSKKK
ncbi:hypothetical protein ACJQWK_10361 [Exserohilum turcicum]|uniref:DUF7730 domain-containing protein n=1 Tax=Exserohilum turcicum (strain 28A) TaxID=671987 RepID=R0IQL6_EXST2|nr:uncharacterized protein SETTUDRAFT_163213 [Exserohilum turcica Et28A]EOA87190.1 hypothetical protein SETTUDRAFT_163213 [Exserohilum turcica Et28A]